MAASEEDFSIPHRIPYYSFHFERWFAPMMQVDYKAFGRRLREYRHARNLTQEKLSELVGVSFRLLFQFPREVLSLPRHQQAQGS